MMEKLKRALTFVMFVAAFIGGTVFDRCNIERDLKTVADNDTMFVRLRAFDNDYDVSAKTHKK